jgi:hypothetical protein
MSVFDPMFDKFFIFFIATVILDVDSDELFYGFNENLWNNVQFFYYLVEMVVVLFVLDFLKDFRTICGNC